MGLGGGEVGVVWCGVCVRAWGQGCRCGGVGAEVYLQSCSGRVVGMLMHAHVCEWIMLQCGAVCCVRLCGGVPYCAVQCSKARFSAVRCSVVP